MTYDYDYKGMANEIINRNINMFDAYDDWTRGAFALSCIPDGRDIFHAISSLSPKYKWRETEYKFNNAMRTNSRITIATFLRMANDNGINIADYRTDGKTTSNVQLTKPTKPTPPPPPPPSYISWDWVQRCASYDSNFVEFLCGLFDIDTIKRLGDLYALGATKDKGVIFWEIDKNGKVRTGKIMHYNAETGHRHDKSNWVHYKLKEKGIIKDFNLSQCLFGQHLLKIYPEKVVALVESEKTALIGAAIFPQYVWCATGGKDVNIGNIEVMKVLSGRKVILFPDTDADGKTFDDWSKKAKALAFCKCHVSDILERYATKAEKMAKIDIGDWLIKSLEENPHQAIREMTDQERILNDMINRNNAIGLLVDVLDLKIVG